MARVNGLPGKTDFRSNRKFLRNGELRMINREDMLELTRRMTPSRTCMDRIAGGYMDEDGFLDGSFNIHFLKLSGEEKAKNLALAKAVGLFSKTNEQLKEYEFSPTQEGPEACGSC